MQIRGFGASPATLAVGAAVAAAAGAAAAAMYRKALTPSVHAQPTPFNQAIIALCPSLTATYTLPALLNNGHVETIFAAFFRRKPHILYDREVVRMPDGGVVTLDTEALPQGQSLPADAPVLILLPGLTGGSEDSYVQHAVAGARAAGIRAVVFNSRGTSGSPVTTPQFYSASFTGDVRCVVGHVAAAWPAARHLYAAGWSLGANILTRYLGEEGEGTPLEAAVAMCNPFDLPLSDANFHRGFNRIYDRNLAKALRRIYARHHALFEDEVARGGKPFQPALALRAATIREFDDAVTRVAFGWPSVDAYYAGSSSSDSIPDVRIPLLVIQAEDDPIAPLGAVPRAALAANPRCVLALTPTGGHLGWASGPDGARGAPWSDAPVVEYFVGVGRLLGAARAAAAAQGEPEGVCTVGSEAHQAP